MAKLFQTGDSSNDDLSNVTLELTSDSWFRRAFLRALLLMTDENNWQQDGTATIDYARDKANEMYVSIAFDVPNPFMMPVGATMTWHVALPPSGWLVCNGQSVAKADYPELYAVWGSQYGETETHFTLLDMTDFSPMGSGGLFPVVNGSGGNFNHTLTIEQIPSHNHPPNGATVFQGSNAGGSTGFEVDIAGQTRVQMTTTGNTGGGLPHPILHPVKAVKWIVYTGQ